MLLSLAFSIARLKTECLLRLGLLPWAQEASGSNSDAPTINSLNLLPFFAPRIFSFLRLGNNWEPLHFLQGRRVPLCARRSVYRLPEL